MKCSNTEIVLASQSPYRRQQLEQLHVPFKVVNPQVDEDALKRAALKRSLSPQELCLYLAQCKAQSLSPAHPEALIIGADQLAELDGEIFGKPQTSENAFLQLKKLSGRTHRLMTALAVSYKRQQYQHLDITELQLRALSEAEIRAYIACDQPLDSAGSYKIEKAGISLIEKVHSEDFTAIMGLPLIALSGILWKLTGAPFLTKETLL